MAVRVTCVNKDNGNHDNPHEAISHYGWINESTNTSGKSDRASMVRYIEKGNSAYVSNGYDEAYCYVRVSPAGNKFLQTKADGQWSNNLTKLPECI